MHERTSKLRYTFITSLFYCLSDCKSKKGLWFMELLTQVLSTPPVLLQGFYLVPVPPHPAVRCDDRTAIWQIWVPAAELTLLTHYAASSVPSRVLSVLEMILQQLRGRTSRQALGGFGLPVTKNQASNLNLLPPLFLLLCGLGGSHVCRVAACCCRKMADVACTIQLNELALFWI